MNYQHIIERIRNLHTRAAGQGSACPDDHQIAAAVDGKLNWADRDAFERHVADCDFCIAKIGRLNELCAVEVPGGFDSCLFRQSLPPRDPIRLYNTLYFNQLFGLPRIHVYQKTL